MESIRGAKINLKLYGKAIKAKKPIVEISTSRSTKKAFIVDKTKDSGNPAEKPKNNIIKIGLLQ